MTAAAALTELARAQVSGFRRKALPPLLEVEAMSKRFGSLVALENVSFRLTPGSFHALLGENGAGKSTLVKCIMGFYQADSGQVLLDGRPISVKSPREARRHGIGMVYQHFTLVENMNVAENLVLSRADVPSRIIWKKELEKIDEFMQQMPFRVEPTRLVRMLAAGERQKLEILKQLYLGSRIVILDEPTSVLTPAEADEVLGMLRDLAHAGEISVAMISHKFREVMAFADEVTVLRRGRLSGAGSTEDLSPSAMAEMMVGSEPPRASLDRTSAASSLCMLKLDGVRADDDIGLPVLKGISLEVRAGEIVGIAGVSGNGQDELVEVLGGQRSPTGGSIEINGKPYRPTRSQMREQRVRLLPEAPLRNACVSNMSVGENIAFRCFDEPAYTFFGSLLNRRSVRRKGREAIRDYSIRAPSVDTTIGELSGGNVQRAVLARELGGDVAVLVVANPCFGLDFAAVSEIRSRIMAARNSGIAVLLVSADLEEIFALSDRILVMSEGKIVHEAAVESANMAQIGRHMAGHHG